jgi:hypothetical protein
MMHKRLMTAYVVFGVASILVASFLGVCWCEENDLGPVRGQVYHENETTPVEGAVVRLQNILEGDAYAALPTGKDGVFEMDNVAQGLYEFVVKTDREEFRSIRPIGMRCRKGETAKLSIVLNDEGERTEDGTGVAWVVVGNHLVVCEFVDIDDNPQEAGPFKPSRPKVRKK